MKNTLEARYIRKSGLVEIKSEILGVIGQYTASSAKVKSIKPSLIDTKSSIPITNADYHKFKNSKTALGFTDHAGVLLPSNLSHENVRNILMAIHAKIDIHLFVFQANNMHVQSRRVIWFNGPVYLFVDGNGQVRGRVNSNSPGLRVPWDKFHSLTLNSYA